MGEDEVEEQVADVVATHVKAVKADEAGEPGEVWLAVRCTDAGDQAQLADRLGREGWVVVKLMAKET